MVGGGDVVDRDDPAKRGPSSAMVVEVIVIADVGDVQEATGADDEESSSGVGHGTVHRDKRGCDGGAYFTIG